MALDFPNSPSVNDSFSAGGKTWVYNGTKWVLLGVSLNQTVADGAITTAKLASDSITSAKIAAGAVGTSDLAANAVTQAKLAANVSGITITTTANRDTDIPSPFTGQFCFLTDTSVLQRYTGSVWIVAIATAPAAPTALSGTALSTTSVSVAFTPGAENGSTITNYQYALSTDSGSTYGSFLAVDPADATSPITISGLTGGTTYTIKLKAVNTMGAGTESAGVSVTTIASLTVDYLVVAGGGGSAGRWHGAGGGAGGLRSTVTATGGGGALETTLGLDVSTNYSVSIGGGGAGGPYGNISGVAGSNTSFSSITSTGGGYGAGYNTQGGPGGSSGGGGGAAGGQFTTGGTRTASPVQGYTGGGSSNAGNGPGSGGGGAGGNGASVSGEYNVVAGGNGGIGAQIAITGSSVYYAGGGGGGGGAGGGAGGLGGGGGGYTAGTTNTGGGGGGATSENPGTGSSGGSGVVILRYPDAYTITIGAGLTGTTATDGSNKVTTITAGSGNVSWA
jgi:hypothetical protein